jgi:hypothetical protein
MKKNSNNKKAFGQTFKFSFYLSISTSFLIGTNYQLAYAEAEANNSYYVERKSFGTSVETEPPKYVKQLNKTWLKDYKGLEDVSWLDIGLDYRIRYEFRNNDFRRSNDVLDEPILLRTRGFIAIKDIFDPFRVTLEVEDARRNHSQFSRDFDTRDINYVEHIQAYAELYFKQTPLGQDDLGNVRPISIKAGRLAFEKIDKRLLARNNYRNTTNNFQGVRATVGEQANDWEIDAFAFNPVQRFTEQLDQRNQSQKFYGIVADWRKWSEVITLQPYYFMLEQEGDKVKYDLNGREEASNARKIDRTIHTAGLRAYGVMGKTGWDYDANYVQQWGHQGISLTNKAEIKHDAYGYNAEIGYTFKHSWKPRLSAFYGLATGDKNATDQKSQRFERLFGFARPWSNTDTFEMSNIRTPKVRVEFEPKVSFISNLKIDAGYSWYSLESDTDTWGPAALKDSTGRSGDKVGEELDITARFPINKFIYTSIGYTHFWAGDFTKRASKIASNANDPTRRDDSDYLYLEVSVSAF